MEIAQKRSGYVFKHTIIMKFYLENFLYCINFAPERHVDLLTADSIQPLSLHNKT